MSSIRLLSQELQEIAKNELNEDPSQIQAYIAILKDWIAITPHLKARTDDQFLLNFLRGCKFSLEKAKSKLDSYYTVRTAVPEVFANRKVDEKLLELMNLKTFFPLPNTKGPAGPRIIFVRHIPYDQLNASIYDAFKIFPMMEDILFEEDDNIVVSGLVYITDCASFSAKDASYYTPAFMKRMFGARLEASPRRLKEIHIFNSNSLLTPLYNIVKGLFSEKISSRFFMHESLEKMCETFPQELLPTEYGGKAGSCAEIADHWIQKFKDYQQFFEEDNKYGTDESLRIGKIKNAEALFGAEGSFKKLEVD